MMSSSTRARFATVAVCAALAACAAQPSQQVASLPPGPPPGEPAGVTGLVAQQVRATFGAPSFVRKDGATEMWRYDTQNCRAFFFLYPDNGGLAVRHVETLPRGATIAADTTCLDALRARAQAVS